MSKPALRGPCSLLAAFLALTVSAGLRAQQLPPPGPAAQTPPTATTPIPSYPESAGGLEKLMKDILRAAKDGDTAKSHALLSSLALPDREAWFREVFGTSAAPMLQANPPSPQIIEEQLSEFFSKMVSEKFTSVTVQQDENVCDPKPDEEIHSVRAIRQTLVPLYEVQFHRHSQFYPLWALAYAQGGFRFLGRLRVPQILLAPKSGAGSPTNQATKRIMVGGSVAQKKLVSQARPHYPQEAKDKFVQGTVRLHAIIGTDGSIQDLRMVSGTCLLVEAAMEAVRQWRYQPTLLSDEPVEVETFIEVTFTLMP